MGGSQRKEMGRASVARQHYKHSAFDRAAEKTGSRSTCSDRRKMGFLRNRFEQTGSYSHAYWLVEEEPLAVPWSSAGKGWMDRSLRQEAFQAYRRSLSA